VFFQKNLFCDIYVVRGTFFLLALSRKHRTPASDDLPTVIPYRGRGVSVLNFQDRLDILLEMRLSSIATHKYVENVG